MGQGIIYLPIVVKGTNVAPEPILRIITNDGKIVDLLEDWEISDPYWRPQIAGYKGDGNYVDSAIADGSRLVSKQYANVVETIPLTARGTDQAQAIKRIRELLQVIRQAADYWTESYEYDYAWLEVRPACNDCRTGYAKIVKANVPELNNPYGQPFFSATNEAVMDDLTLIIEREPLWRGVQPGTIIGPLYNMAKNPDFELWNFGVTDSQPDSWSDLETTGITGANSRESDNHSGNFALEVRVSQSTAANRIKGVSQIIASTRPNTQYTVVVWARNDGVSNGVGRVLVTYSSQLEVYRSSTKHGWQLYTGTFTTGASDTVAINLEILTTAANTDGTVYFDSLMILEGDWEQEAIEGMLPYMTSSHIVNHWDQPTNNVVEAGDINWVDMWSVPGDESALVRLEVQNNTIPADFSEVVELFAKIRIGMRRTKDVQNLQNYQDFAGIVDTTASSDDRIESVNLNSDWLNIGTKNILGVGNVLDNEGRFRVFARVYDPVASGNPTLQIRLNYFIGTAGINEKILDEVTASIISNWTTVNLTANAAMIWDRKFSPNPPTQIGYTVQMRRLTGTDKGRLDYVIAMPTDGGYIEANIEPPLVYKNALVIDNTMPALTVSAILKREQDQWIRLYAVGDGATPVAIGTDGIFLYISDDTSPGVTPSRIHKLNLATQTAQVFSLTSLSNPSDTVPAIEFFNGRLYFTHNTGVYETDGITFPGVQRVNVSSSGADKAFYMKSFAGKLYISARATGPTRPEVWTWDGATATKLITFSAGNFDKFEVYAGHLFFPASTDTIREYNPATNTWTAHVPYVGTNLGDLAVFQNKLYYTFEETVGFTTKIYYYDGHSWNDTGFTAPSNGTFEMVALDDSIYMWDGAATYVSTDGINFTQINFTTPRPLMVFNGSLVGTVRVFANGEGVYILSPQDIEYAVSDFQGVSFAAPPRNKTNEKRHRYVFSCDRTNNINNIDDQVLVGIGIVPLYLALIGES